MVAERGVGLAHPEADLLIEDAQADVVICLHADQFAGRHPARRPKFTRPPFVWFILMSRKLHQLTYRYMHPPKCPIRLGLPALVYVPVESGLIWVKAFI